MTKLALRIFLVISLLFAPISCAGMFGYQHTEMPTIEVPAAPVKPNIDSVTTKIGDTFYICYSIKDAMRLYHYLLERDAYDDKLIFRIEQMNKLIKEFGKARE